MRKNNKKQGFDLWHFRRVSMCIIAYIVFFFFGIQKTQHISAKAYRSQVIDQEVRYITALSFPFEEETLNIGDSLTLPVNIKYSDGSVITQLLEGESLGFKSSNTKIVEVSSNGRITAKAAGVATIQVKTLDGMKTATCSIRVKQPKLSKEELTLYTGEDYWLYVRNGNGKITWKSSNTSVATISSTGKIVANKAGTATITVVRSNVTMKCRVTVKEVKISKSKLSIYEGQTYRLKIVRTDKKIEWSSSDRSIATISKNGNVEAKKPGKVTITATIGKSKYRCILTVLKSNLLVSKKKITISEKGKVKIPITCKTKDFRQIIYQVSHANIISFEITDRVKTNANITILPKKVGEVELRIYRRTQPEDVKIIKIKVEATSISEKPNIQVMMGKETKKSTIRGAMTIHNLGSKKVTIQPIAYSYDFEYSGYDRTMRLIHPSTGEYLNTMSVMAAKKKEIVFRVDGKATWYDRKTKYYFYMHYDGLDYEVISSAFLGTTIRLL